MNIEKDILSLIETSIKKGNENINLFALNLITNLKKITSTENLEDIISKRIANKNIYFLRHGEAEHNVLERKYFGDFSKCNVYNPGITQEGINQTKLTIEKFKNDFSKFEAVFVSPLKRTIQTFSIVKDYLNKDIQIIITDFVREVISYCDKNKGKQLSLLKKEFEGTNFNFDYMTKEYWWFDLGKNKDDELEKKPEFNTRLRIFILWLIFRPEKNILIISHSHTFFNLQDYGIVNAGMAKMDNKILLVKILNLLLAYEKK